MPLASTIEAYTRLSMDRPGAWSQEQRDKIAKWLRDQANELMLHGESYVTRTVFLAEQSA